MKPRMKKIETLKSRALAILSKESTFSDVAELVESGCSLDMILLKERDVFPKLIPAQPTTARKSRSTGTLLGIKTVKYVKVGRSVFYRLSDVIEWLDNLPSFSTTAHYAVAVMGDKGQ